MDLSRVQSMFHRVGLAHRGRALMQHGLKSGVTGEHRKPDHGRAARGLPYSRGDQSGDDDGREIRIDDEGCRKLRAPVGERREDHGAEGGDHVPCDMDAYAQRHHAHERAPGIFSAHQ